MQPPLPKQPCVVLAQKRSVDSAKKRHYLHADIPQYGLQFIEHEEANTSAASFLDGDSLPAFGEKPEGWQSSGKRVKRGLFRIASNWYINADANAAANIIGKVAATLGIDLNGVSRGSLTTPTRIKFWVTAKKTRRGTADSPPS